MKNKNIFGMMALLSGFVLLSACQGPTSCSVNVVSGLINIRSVTIKGQGLVGNVTISNMKMNGEPVNNINSFIEFGSSNITPVSKDNQLLCKTACAFGVSGNSYTFDVSAAGAKAKTISLSIPIKEKRGGCGISASTGTKQNLDIELEPSQ